MLTIPFSASKKLFKEKAISLVETSLYEDKRSFNTLLKIFISSTDEEKNAIMHILQTHADLSLLKEERLPNAWIKICNRRLLDVTLLSPDNQRTIAEYLDTTDSGEIAASLLHPNTDPTILIENTTLKDILNSHEPSQSDKLDLEAEESMRTKQAINYEVLYQLVKNGNARYIKSLLSLKIICRYKIAKMTAYAMTQESNMDILRKLCAVVHFEELVQACKEYR